jgi:sterol desaturase/sphingolipid hydroxylase (fatty acid hydroxylase superfamily)
MTPLEKFLLFVAAPAVVLCSLVEALVLSRRGAYDWRELGVSFFDFALRIAVLIAVPFSLGAPLVRWAWEHRLTTIRVDDWASALALFLLLEFFYYWLHRAGHRVRWFWANHAVHHTPNQLNLAASLRIGAFGKLTGNVLFLLPLVSTAARCPHPPAHAGRSCRRNRRRPGTAWAARHGRGRGGSSGTARRGRPGRPPGRGAACSAAR